MTILTFSIKLPHACHKTVGNLAGNFFLGGGRKTQAFSIWIAIKSLTSIGKCWIWMMSPCKTITIQMGLQFCCLISNSSAHRGKNKHQSIADFFMSSITLVDCEITVIMAGNVWMGWRWTCSLVCLQTCWNHKLCFNMITFTEAALVIINWSWKYRWWILLLVLNEVSLIKFWQINRLIKYNFCSYKTSSVFLIYINKC